MYFGGIVLSLPNKKIEYYKKDEKMATKEYSEAAKKVSSEVAKDMFLAMSKDEARHAKMLEMIKKLENEPEEKKSIKDKLTGKKSYEEKVQEYFEKEGVYSEQGIEDNVFADRPDLPEENEWNEEYED